MHCGHTHTRARTCAHTGPTWAHVEHTHVDTGLQDQSKGLTREGWSPPVWPRTQLEGGSSGRAQAVPGLKPGGWGPARGGNSPSFQAAHSSWLLETQHPRSVPASATGTDRSSGKRACPVPQGGALRPRAAWLLTKRTPRGTEDGAHQVAPRLGPGAANGQEQPRVRWPSAPRSCPGRRHGPGCGPWCPGQGLAGSGSARRPRPRAPAPAAAPACPPGRAGPGAHLLF